MCGIIGFAGRDQAAPILLDGLERMECALKRVAYKSEKPRDD